MGRSNVVLAYSRAVVRRADMCYTVSPSVDHSHCPQPEIQTSEETLLSAAAVNKGET